MYTIYTGLHSVKTRYSRLFLNKSSSGYNGNLAIYAWPLPSLSILYFLCRALPCIVFRICAFWWFWVTCACLLNLKLSYDRRSVSDSHLESMTIFFFLWQLRVSWCDAPFCREGTRTIASGPTAPSPAELKTIFYCFIRDSTNLEGQVPVFISPGTGWPSYISRHRIPFSSLLTTLSEVEVEVEVEVF
jgi:hypothetical protein